MNIFKKAIVKTLAKHVQINVSQLEVPTDSRHGDFALPCYDFAKEFHRSPQQIAQKLAKDVKYTHPISEIRNIGPYLNFFIATDALAEYALKKIYSDKKYGHSNDKKKIMVEYSSPNTNKPLHLGHIRNIVIGKSMANILSFAGNKVIQSCLVNDRGIHITKSMLAYQKWGNGEPDKKSDHFVGEYYVMFNEKAKIMPRLDQQAHTMLQQWEAKDKDVLALWKKMNTWAEKGFSETYHRLGIKFNKYYYESKLYNKGRTIVLNAQKKGIFALKDGAVVASLKEYKLPDKVLIRKDGTTLYMTQDINLAVKKIKDYHLDTSIYVVGSEQENHFRQLFKILELLGYKSDSCVHMSYGMVYLPEGRMKSREGTVVDADNIIDEMIKLARIEVHKRHEDLNNRELEQRARIIGIGALKFFMLRTDVSKDMTYNPKESISFEGETGPYVQYAYARIASILRKYGKKVKKSVDFSCLGKDEKLLLVMLMKYPDIINQAKDYKPSVVCRYLLDLSQAFNEYYHKIPILKAKDPKKSTRILFIYCIQSVLKSGLAILDIETLEEM